MKIKLRCPECKSIKIKKEYDDYYEEIFICEECDYTSPAKSEFLYSTRLPVEMLEISINFLEQYSNELTSGDMADEHGICYIVGNIIEYLNNLKKLYLECCKCGRIIAPDEVSFYLFSEEDYCCIECHEGE